MTKALDANVLAQLAAASKKPVTLIDIALTGTTLRYAAYHSNIVFPHGGAITYTAKAIIVGQIEQRLEGQIGRVSLQFDNVSRDMAAYVNSYDFEGRDITIKRVYLDASNHAPVTDTEYIEMFHGIMENPKEINRVWLELSATEGKPLNKKVLTDKYSRQCNRVFGDAQCNANGFADLTSLTASGTADSGTTTTLVDNALTQADDYWNYGYIVLVKGGVTYNRKVKDFDAATDTVTFDLAIPVAVDNTTTYNIYKGCDKSWDCCQSNQAYGPSSDNSQNFGGFIHIGIWKESGK